MSKLMSDIASKTLTTLEPKLVSFINVVGGWRRLDQPQLSSELKCPLCDGDSHYTPIAYPERGDERVWICAGRNCVPLKEIAKSTATTTPTVKKRVKEWSVWCQENEIGDMDRGACFENLDQPLEYITKIRNFMTGKKPFLLFLGNPGGGKTYASLAICEKFTSLNASCVFMTQKRLSAEWAETFKSDRIAGFVPKISNVSLLIVDDFGTGNPSQAFMSFFMDVMNTRMQWSKRKTIITSNLDPKQFADVCGDALMDRFRTGEIIKIDRKSRR